MHFEILDFISRRWQTDSNFLNGNCYWFALILSTRFNKLEIYYLPVEGHFIAGDGKSFYDWTGEINIKNYARPPLKFKQIELEDPLWYSRLIRDCVD